MHLRFTRRKKDSKEHRYWSVVESRRCAGGRVVQKPLLYLGEINDSQHAAWCRVIEGFDEDSRRSRQLALFPAERALPDHAKAYGVQVWLGAMRLERPRQWGACWLACELYEQLGLDRFWAQRLPDSREGTRWRHVLQTLVCYRLIDPGSEWRLHRQWFEHSAMADLLGADDALVAKDTLYRCLDKLLAHKEALFSHLRGRWQDLFGASFEVLLYDLTSTYFESPPPEDQADKRRHGYSRDKRGDCVQVVIALIVTPEGFPLAYEVLPGNTADSTTLRAFLHRIEAQYGRAQRIWVMDRGIPTEAVLSEMRQAEPPVSYLVGTPKGRLTRMEQALLGEPWQAVRPGVEVKLLSEEPELYGLARSRARIDKERAIRQRQLKRLWKRLGELSAMQLSRDELVMKLGCQRRLNFPHFCRSKIPQAAGSVISRLVDRVLSATADGPGAWAGAVARSGLSSARVRARDRRADEAGSSSPRSGSPRHGGGGGRAARLRPRDGRTPRPIRQSPGSRSGSGRPFRSGRSPAGKTDCSRRERPAGSRS